MFVFVATGICIVGGSDNEESLPLHVKCHEIFLQVCRVVRSPLLIVLIAVIYFIVMCFVTVGFGLYKFIVPVKRKKPQW